MATETQPEDRFTRIVRELDAELTAKEKEIADLKSKLRTANYPTEQATNCGKCGKYKHTPWRDDEHGYGHVCAPCLVNIFHEHIAELAKQNNPPDRREACGRGTGSEA